MTGSTELVPLNDANKLPALKGKKKKNSFSAKSLAKKIKQKIYDAEMSVPAGAVYAGVTKNIETPLNFFSGDHITRKKEAHALYLKIAKRMVGYNVDMSLNTNRNDGRIHMLTIKVSPRLEGDNLMTI